MRGAFSLIEMIFTVVVASILALGSFKALEALYTRSAKAKAITELSLRSQIVLDQLSVLLYNRIANSVIGYNPFSGACEAIADIDETQSLQVLAWLSLDEEQLMLRRYDGFVDMNESARPVLSTPATAADLNVTGRNLIFAGAFDKGESTLGACNGAYGWPHADSNLSFPISAAAGSITFTAEQPEAIFEKFYLTDGGYAVARGADVQTLCALSPHDYRDLNNTLLLFYGFRPYEGERFCDGSVAILAEEVIAFRATYVNNAIRLAIDLNRSVRGSSAVHVSKQKAVF